MSLRAFISAADALQKAHEELERATVRREQLQAELGALNEEIPNLRATIRERKAALAAAMNELKDS